MLCPRFCRLALLLAPFPFLSAPVRAQVVVVDEGIFTITVGGTRVGREDFSIRRSLVDGALTAQGNVLRTDSRSAVVLSTDSTGLPQRFQYDRFVGGRISESTSGEYRRGLWSGRAVNPKGESAREFRLPDVVVAADDGVIHHAWFLLEFVGTGPVPMLRPRGLTVGPVSVERTGEDTVLFGLERYEAVRWTIREGVGGPVLREVWADAQGRLLRVRVPAADLEATRDEPPPETPPSAEAYEGSRPLHIGNRIDAFAVACDPAARLGDAAGGPDGPLDADPRRSARDREEEQPDLPAVGDGPDARIRRPALGVRPAAP